VVVLAGAVPTGSDAAVVTVKGVQYGVQAESTALPVTPTTPIADQGGPVLHASAPYAIFWDPHTTMGGYAGIAQHFLESLSDESGALTNGFDVASQYADAGGKAAYQSTFRGAYTDTDPFPSTGNCSEAGSPCLTDAQIRAELAKAIESLGLPTGVNPEGGPTPTYFIFTPSAATVCLEGSGESGHCSDKAATEPLCSYHSSMTVNSATVAYAVEPLAKRSGCQDGTGTVEEPNAFLYGGLHAPGVNVLLNDVATQQIAMATDPLLNGWRQAGSPGAEVTDPCRNEFSPSTGTPPELSNGSIGGTTYYLNDVYNQAALKEGYPATPCLNTVTNEPKFTATSPVRSGDVVTFNTTSSYIDLGVASYHWSFGDGTGTEANCENRIPTNGFEPRECTGTSGTNITNPVASTQHVYQYGGTYTVTLSVVDGGGNAASVSHNVTVSGPTAPATSQGGSSTSSSSGSSAPAGTTAGTSQTSGAGTTPAAGGSPSSATPIVATAKVASRSLATALRRGLAVNYTVDRQVAGRFEVLLATSLAHRVGLHGPAATALAAGTPGQVVIAKAVLVTAKGGHGTYRIIFSKTTAARLRKLHHVSLTVRMVVHSATSAGATTVVSNASLH
jgi:PKD domain